MELQAFLPVLAKLLWEYFPEEMDSSLKPIDSSGCLSKRNFTYDFIIVGGGLSGCVLANRLSENPEWKILLIEAGGDEDFITNTPAFNIALFQSQYVWNYTTVEQESACLSQQGICGFTRGKVLGGSSSINGMVYNRGPKEDYDEWETMGNPGWGYKDIFHYFLKIENMTVSELASSPYHSTKGPLSIGYGKYRADIMEDMLNGYREYGLKIADYSGKQNTQIVNYALKTVRGPTRCSSNRAYLKPIRNRKNLVVFKNTEVIKILFNNGKPKRAVGVTCVTNGEQYNVYTSKEVILSAGSINSPKLLMLSGVGPRDHLEKMKIPIKASIEAVGANLIDCPGLEVSFRTSKSYVTCCNQYTYDNALEYARDRKGPLTTNNIEIIGLMNRENSTKLPPDLTIEALTGTYSTNYTVNTSNILAFLVTLYNVKSSGSLRLASNKYTDQPLIDPNYFGDPTDLDRLLWGFKQAFKLVGTSAMAEYSIEWNDDITSPPCGQYSHDSDEFWKCYIRYVSGPSVHAVGTCRMGQINDIKTVVNSNLSVHHLSGLRVIDASVMPRIPRASPGIPTYVVAEKGADIIKRCYSN